jgi:hypothetical protein
MTRDASQSFLARLWRHAKPLDMITMGYITLFGLGIIIFGRDHESWKTLLTVHLALLCGSAWMVVNWHDRERGLSGFLRQLYPPLLYAFFYTETRVAILWIIPAYQDARLLAFERMIFGADLNSWLIPFQKALINEWMMMGYFSYYLLVPLVALPLFFQHRIVELNRFLTAATLTFVISYFGFILYPVEGPRYFLAGQFTEPLSGYLFVPLVRWIIANGAVHGGCMPSSHVAVAWVALYWAYRTQRRLAIVLTPLVGTLFIATVWGRFHYISDVAVGWPVGMLGLWLAARLKTAPASPDASIRLGRQVRRNRVAKTMGEAEQHGV